MFYTYVLKNTKGILYKGSTDDLEKRVNQHNSNSFKSFTRGRGPWILVYSEEFHTRQEAELREKYFKSKAGWYYLKNTLNLL